LYKVNKELSSLSATLQNEALSAVIEINEFRTKVEVGAIFTKVQNLELALARTFHPDTTDAMLREYSQRFIETCHDPGNSPYEIFRQFYSNICRDCTAFPSSQSDSYYLDKLVDAANLDRTAKGALRFRRFIFGSIGAFTRLMMMHSLCPPRQSELKHCEDPVWKARQDEMIAAFPEILEHFDEQDRIVMNIPRRYSTMLGDTQHFLYARGLPFEQDNTRALTLYPGINDKFRLDPVGMFTGFSVNVLKNVPKYCSHCDPIYTPFGTFWGYDCRDVQCGWKKNYQSTCAGFGPSRSFNANEDPGAGYLTDEPCSEGASNQFYFDLEGRMRMADNVNLCWGVGSIHRIILVDCDTEAALRFY
jgi:hypothetical protein